MKYGFIDRLVLRVAGFMGWELPAEPAVRPEDDPDRPAWARDMWRQARGGGE